MLELYTEFEEDTAKQLAFERNRDNPNDKDLQDAVIVAAKWNKQRIKLKLRPFK